MAVLMPDLIEVPRTALARLVVVAVHVSLGARAAFVTPYPDATARAALGELDEAGLLEQFQPPRGFRDASHVVLSDEELAAFEAHAQESLALANERSYAEKVNAPLSPEVVEALRKELASDNPARYRKREYR